jgi:hypothetical protein
MATSGTLSTTTYRTAQFLDDAIRRCKVRPETLSAEDILAAKNALYLFMSALGNKGDLLWAVEKVIVPVYEGQAFYNMPLGTVDSRNVNFRLLTRLTGTYASSAGGTVANAFDDDFSTALTQTSGDGSVTTTFTSDTQVTNVGILPNADATYTLTMARSDDNITYTTVYTSAAYAAVAGTWAWFDIDGNLAATYFKITLSGGATLDVREIYIGGSPTEIPMARINQDDYTNLPNKTFSGKPLQFWLDRRRTYPVMNTWPVCDLTNRYGQIVIWRTRYLEDVGTLAEELDFPQRWFQAMVWALAEELAMIMPTVDPAWVPTVQAKAASTWFEAQQEERDNSPTMLSPAIAVYTR